MDWSNERYARLYTRDTTTWKLLDWRARCTLALLLRKVSRAGILEVDGHGIRGLAAALEMPYEVVKPGVEQLMAEGIDIVVQTPNAFVLSKYIEAQEAISSPAHRSREYRARQRDMALAGVTFRDGSVTKRDDQDGEDDFEDQDSTVTKRDAGVTKRDGSVTKRDDTPPETVTLVPVLSGERSDPPAPSGLPDPDYAPIAISGGVQTPRTPAPEEISRGERDRWCTAKWAELNAHRARIAKRFGLDGVRDLSPMDAGRRDLAMRVRDGGDSVRADVEHVIAVRVAEAEATKSVRWLGGGMFDLHGDQWRNAIAMTPDDARRPRGTKPPTTTPMRSAPVSPNDEDTAFLPRSHRKDAS